MSTTFVHDIRESEPFALGSERKPGRSLTVDLAEAIIGEGPRHNEDLIRYARRVRVAPPEVATWQMSRPSAGTAPTGTRSWR